MKSRFEIVETTDDYLVIRDLNGPMSVTNDVENVVKYLYNGDLLGDLELYYIDSEGKEDQILHDGSGNFVAFNIM
jgi:hypothetical protein